MYFFNIPNDIFSAVIATVSVHREYLILIQFTTDTTFLNYNAIFNDRTSNNVLNSTFINTQKTLNGTRNLTQHDFQTPSDFLSKGVVETLPITTQQSISPIYPVFTTYFSFPFLPTTLQSTVKTSLVPQNSHMDYQTNSSKTKQRPPD